VTRPSLLGVANLGAARFAPQAADEQRAAIHETKGAVRASRAAVDPDFAVAGTSFFNRQGVRPI